MKELTITNKPKKPKIIVEPRCGNCGQLKVAHTVTYLTCPDVKNGGYLKSSFQARTGIGGS